MEKITLTCIGCPLGCQIRVTKENDEVTDVTGNTCKRGAEYARKEVTNPTRIVTSTVGVTGSLHGEKTVSCKTQSDVPKNRIFAVMKDLKGVQAEAPVRIGDILLENAGGTGVCIIATKNVE